LVWYAISEVGVSISTPFIRTAKGQAVDADVISPNVCPTCWLVQFMPKDEKQKIILNFVVQSKRS
jgi:hypothetical protein